MDWLPKPAKVHHPLPDVPCLTETGYDHDPDWLGYPERQGWHPRSGLAWLFLLLS